MPSLKEHNLTSLVGKKIKSVTLKEVDMHGDGRNIRQCYVVVCSDNEQFALIADGNNTSQYAVIELLELDEFEQFLEELDELSDDDSDEDEDSVVSDDIPDDDEFDKKLFDDRDDDDDDF